VSKKSKYQKIELYNTEKFGKVLLIDGIIMLTEADEFAYHEMIAHVPLSIHPLAKKVLIIGGGDGGAAREILKHDIEELDICEIDSDVIDICKKYLPTLANSFDDKRVKVIHKNGADFIKDKKEEYDVIIVDSTDPIGPGKELFTEEFYISLYKALKKEGIAVTQSESMFYDKDVIKELFSFSKKLFPIVKYYYTLVPSYPSGMIGFSLCSKKYDSFNDKGIKGLKYYNADMHKASFKLPSFMEKII
jgi:spermidine synthase